MKKNALLVTTLLYPIGEGQDLFHTIDSAHAVVPHLSRGGVRSMLHLLVKRGVLASESLNAVSRFYLTSAGKEELIAQFPALDVVWETYSGEWHCIVFQDAPESDPQFRYLRSQVLKENALQLSRGVYVIPGAFSQEFLRTCQKLYGDAVALFTATSWDWGLERSVVTRNYALSDLATAYSGISREISLLLAKKKENNDLTNRQKQQFVSVYDRFRDLLCEDRGVVAHYYPKAVTARQLLQLFQQFFFDTFTNI